jgi:hypothetical protein
VNTWPDAYQVLLRAGNIEHDPLRGSRARDMKLVEAMRIDEPPSWWQEWSFRTQPSLLNWLAVSGGGRAFPDT